MNPQQRETYFLFVYLFEILFYFRSLNGTATWTMFSVLTLFQAHG